MDYGKLAYLKAEDLERAFARSSVKAAAGFSGGRYCFEPARSVLGEYYLTDIVASGSVCLILKALAAPQKKDSLELLIDSRPCARVAIEAGKNEYVVLAQTKITGSASLSIATNGTFVSALELMVIGGEAVFGGREISGDAAHNKAAVLLCSNEKITIFKGEENGLDFGQGAFEAVGVAMDAAFGVASGDGEGSGGSGAGGSSDGGSGSGSGAGGSGDGGSGNDDSGERLYVVLLDLCGNLWLKDYCLDRYRFLGSGFGGNVSIAVGLGGASAGDGSTGGGSDGSGDGSTGGGSDGSGDGSRAGGSGSGGDSSGGSVGAFEGGICVAAVRDGFVEVFDLDTILDVPVAVRVTESDNARAVRLAKGGGSHVLAIKTKNAGSYFLQAEQEAKQRAVAKLEIRASVN